MRELYCERSFVASLLFAVCISSISGCGKSSPPEASSKVESGLPGAGEKKPLVDLLKDEIPPNQLDETIRAHYQGLGAMERYEYRNAVEAFREVSERAPGWIPGSINLAIALLNDSGVQAEDAKKKNPAKAAVGNFDEALALLDEVILRDPLNLNAHYSRGLILEFNGKFFEAHKDFRVVTENDPKDGHAWYKLGATLTKPGDPLQPAQIEQARELIEIYTKALECNPYLVTAMYRLQQAYGWARERGKQMELLAYWRKINPKTNAAGSGETAEAFYGESGKYAKVIHPFAKASIPKQASPAPRFDPPTAIKVTLGAGERWVQAEDFTGRLAVIGRARARFGATVATFDANGDGVADLYLAASIKGEKGIRDALLLNKGEGEFEDVSKAWGLPEDRASLGVAAADFDADRRLDVYLSGLDGGHLLRNDRGKGFVDVTEKAGMDKSKFLGLTARWLDLDQDGDLDLYVVNFTDLEHAGDAFGEMTAPKAVNAAYRNIGKPAAIKGRPEDNWAPLAVAASDLPATEGLSIEFSPWPDAEGLLGPAGNYTSVAALDVDDDRDLDVVLESDGDTLIAAINDRLGKFHSIELKGLAKEGLGGSLLVTDLDKDGKGDLALVRGSGPILAWRNTTDLLKAPREISWARWPVDANGIMTAKASDLDLDTWPDLVGVPARSDGPVVSWLRNEGERLATQGLAMGPGMPGLKQYSGFALADLVGDALCDVLTLADGMPPQLAKNLGNGEHWLALDLGGRWKTSFDHMRTNPQAIGVRVTIEGQGLLVTYEHTTPSAGLGQSVGPVVLGLGKAPSVDLLRLRWPDGTMQCEVNQKADVKLALAETNRKTGSCPVLFTWNGARFVCLGDFLGGGGLGYLVAPGVYGQPDRDEAVAITAEQLKAVGGVFRLSVTEPMDEVAYLDRLELVAVDRPAGVSATPDERFAPEGPRPTGEVIAWKSVVKPVAATDLKGRDILKALSAWDRDTADGFRKLDGWVGYAEEHGIVLDFGDRLSKFGPGDALVLALAGWVEYPYSQTNYAAGTAGVVLKPPSVERRNADGTWAVIEPHAGYPAGLPRMTTLDLTGKLNGPSCVIRLRTNMECYWDQAFIAIRDREAEGSLRQTVMRVSRGVLGHRGYSRESSPDGREPLIYDYDHVDPAPLALMGGKLTRYGEVSGLLREDDDQLCLVGPGDEVRLEFSAEGLGDLPEGWTRSYVLKAVGYCKDADPLTAGSDRVEPLPWRGMPNFPFASEKIERPVDRIYADYLKSYQTRPAGVR